MIYGKPGISLAKRSLFPRVELIYGPFQGWGKDQSEVEAGEICSSDATAEHRRRVLALLKYPFYYTIRKGFGNFFGMIHVLTHHLAPEFNRFRFCPRFWSMLCFGRKLDIFGDVLTYGHNWAKMRNKEKRPHAKDGTERG